jgi:hypothetical protein
MVYKYIRALKSSFYNEDRVGNADGRVTQFSLNFAKENKNGQWKYERW